MKPELLRPYTVNKNIQTSAIPALQTSMISKPMFSPSLSQSVQMTKAWHSLTSFSSVRYVRKKDREKESEERKNVIAVDLINSKL